MKRIPFIFATLFALLLTGCSQDELVKDPVKSPENGLRLSYKVSGIVSAASRATIPTEEAEDQLNSFYILFYDNDIAGGFVQAVDAMNTYSTPISGVGVIDIEFPEDSPLSVSGDYVMLCLANIEAYRQELTSVETLTEFCRTRTMNQVIRELTLEISGVEPTPDNHQAEQADNTNRMYPHNLPMSTIVGKAPHERDVEVELSRGVSRFDVASIASGYKLVSASIWNAYTRGYVFEEEGRLDTYSRERTQRYYGVGANQNAQIVGALYAFENRVKEPAQKDKKTTCLIIGLENLQTQDVEYFRANISTTSLGQHLKRNNVYKTTVRSVSGPGEDTERKAYENSDMLLELNINDWFLDDYGVIQYDGENILAIPTARISLFPQGEEREYDIFTLSKDPDLSLEMTIQDLSAGITAELTGNKLKIKATRADSDRSGKLIFTFGALSATIEVDQSQYIIPDFLELSQYELPVFLSSAAQQSAPIQVTASGDWEAEIYNGTYFSFGSGSVQKATTEGKSGESFRVYTIQANTTSEMRYCFIQVRLKSDPTVSRVVLLKQAGTGYQYLDYTPKSFLKISAGGGSTEKITVTASGTWKATISVSSGGSAYFQDYVEDNEEEDEDEEEEGDDGNDYDEDDGDDDQDEPKYYVWNSSQGDSFIVTFDGLEQINVAPVATITLELVGSTLKETFTIEQTALSSHNVVVQTRSLVRGSLYNPAKSVTYRHVFNLATTLRNSSMFGPGGVVPMNDHYVFLKSGTKPLTTANIFQVSGDPSLKFTNNYIVKWWKEDSDRLLIFSHNPYAFRSMRRFYSKSGIYDTSKYTVEKCNVPALNKRYFNPDPQIRNHPLVQYLIDGVFGEVDVEKLEFYGKDGVNSGFTKWPETFIPLLMADKTDGKGKVTTYCIFGIDPTHRYIWMGDSSIFGSSKTADKNSANFASLKKDNTTFMNNFIAWMTNAGVRGKSFMDQYK